jgi:hypothetical protein
MGTILLRRRRRGGRGTGRIAGDQRLICWSIGCDDGVDTAGATRSDTSLGAPAGDGIGVTGGKPTAGTDPECAFGVVDLRDGWSSPAWRGTSQALAG